MQESVSELLLEAGTLLLVGMSVVFVFLTLLIVAINLIAYLCAKFPEEKPQVPARRPAARTTTAEGELSPATVAAIGAAIHKYRNSH